MIVYLVAELINGKTEFRPGHCFVEMQLSLIAVLINVSSESIDKALYVTIKKRVTLEQ